MKCKECGELLVPCGPKGERPGTGYLVCPVALGETTPGEFAKPWRRRLHRNAHIEETAEHRKHRLEAARAQQHPLLDPEAGKRAKA